MYKIEVDDTTFAIRIWDLDNPNSENKPFMFQPTYPDGTSFPTKEAALDWASQQERFMTVPDSPPPFGGPTAPQAPSIEPSQEEPS